MDNFIWNDHSLNLGLHVIIQNLSVCWVSIVGKHPVLQVLIIYRLIALILNEECCDFTLFWHSVSMTHSSDFIFLLEGTYPFVPRYGFAKWMRPLQNLFSSGHSCLNWVTNIKRFFPLNEAQSYCMLKLRPLVCRLLLYPSHDMSILTSIMAWEFSSHMPWPGIKPTLHQPGTFSVYSTEVTRFQTKHCLSNGKFIFCPHYLKGLQQTMSVYWLYVENFPLKGKSIQLMFLKLKCTWQNKHPL